MHFGRRLVSLWPAERPLTLDCLPTAPWADVGRLLAELHAVPLEGVLAPSTIPLCTAAERVADAVARLGAKGDPDTTAVRAAFATLPDWKAASELPDVRTSLVHGDWHLGQVVSLASTARPEWRLIDVDDLGFGDPAWDLARPAAFFTAGLLPSEEWETFLSAYRRAGGTAIPPAGDPWRKLDAFARALVVQCAARALEKARRASAGLDENAGAFLSSCRRIAAFGPTLR